MELNEQQKQAINTNNKHVLILAGAGTGKTRVIINKIVELVNNNIPINKIIATTFTNKAAFELKERIIQSIGEKGNSILCGTFHKISAQILRIHYEKIGLTNNFQLLNEDDQKRIVKKILLDLKEDTTLTKSLLEKISKFKETKAEELKNELFKKVFDKYQDELTKNNFLDYADLIEKNIFLFKNYPELTYEICEYLLVDEYQDINNLQYDWIKYLSINKNLFCVGDEDQSIYAFRGANIRYIQQFWKDYPDCEVIKLEENYRSCSQILNGANNLIQKNPKQFEKKLFSTNGEFNGKIRITKVFNEFEEAIFIAKTIAEWKHQFPNYKIGVLVRTNMQINYIEQALVEAKIPYLVNSGKKFYQKKEIQDVMAYLRVLHSKNDFLAFSRAINTPKRNIGETRLNSLLDAMKYLQCDFENALNAFIEQLPRNASEKCKILVMQLMQWRKLKDTIPLETLIDKILLDINYIELEEIKENQLKNIDSLKDQAKKYKTLQEFLENVQFENQEENADVELMTMHASKGLEFDIVFAPGWEESIFPSMMTRSKEELEEERRLAYVTITRARHFLEISYAKSRKINNRYMNQLPSRFIYEI